MQRSRIHEIIERAFDDGQVHTITELFVEAADAIPISIAIRRWRATTKQAQSDLDQVGMARAIARGRLAVLRTALRRLSQRGGRVEILATPGQRGIERFIYRGGPAPARVTDGQGRRIPSDERVLLLARYPDRQIDREQARIEASRFGVSTDHLMRVVRQARRPPG
jgi:hypothetical protein